MGAEMQDGIGGEILPEEPVEGRKRMSGGEVLLEQKAN